MWRRWVLLAWIGCGRSDLYAPCDVSGDCAGPEGSEPVCLEKASEGFCTWACRADDDCAFDEDDYLRVCASFESDEGRFCFPACREDGDTPEVCPPGFGCRSTGGGRDNRRVCFPEDVPDSEPADVSGSGPNGNVTNLP